MDMTQKSGYLRGELFLRGQQKSGPLLPTDRNSVQHAMLGTLDLANVSGLKPLRTSLDVELYLVAFDQVLVAVAHERFVVDEHIFAATALNESEAFGSIEPLNDSFFHGKRTFLLC